MVVKGIAEAGTGVPEYLGKDISQAFGAEQVQLLGTLAQTQGIEQPEEAEVVVTVEMRYKNSPQAAGAKLLFKQTVLGTFSAVNQEALVPSR
ncbi:hypothetical protein GCM10027291_06930 [Telluribacter humicola]